MAGVQLTMVTMALSITLVCELVRDRLGDVMSTNLRDKQSISKVARSFRGLRSLKIQT